MTLYLQLATICFQCIAVYYMWRAYRANKDTKKVLAEYGALLDKQRNIRLHQNCSEGTMPTGVMRFKERIEE